MAKKKRLINPEVQSSYFNLAGRSPRTEDILYTYPVNQSIFVTARLSYLLCARSEAMGVLLNVYAEIEYT